MNLFKLSLFLLKFDLNYFDVPKEEQERYINSLGEPKDDWDRSYKQYQCQRYFNPWWKVCIYNIVSALVFPFYLLLLWVKGFFLKYKTEVDAVGRFKTDPEVLPEVLTKQYHINNDLWDTGSILSLKDICYLGKYIIRYYYSPRFLLKSMAKIALYRGIIRQYNPRAIVECVEFSYTSSLLTDYCHQNGLKHINVMHGEKLFFMRDSFFHFDECYIWSEFYKQLFTSLKADPNQFIIAIPPSLKIDIAKYKNPSVFADYKYYLAEFTEDEIISISESMDFARREGKKVIFRAHPRFSNMSVLKRHIDAAEIEYPKEVNILESIANADNIIGDFSTTMTQGYFSGKNVIVDDVTFKDHYKKLKSYGYFLANVDTQKLSQFQ